MTLFNPAFDFRNVMTEMHHRSTLTHDLSAAVVAGQFAGLVMAAVMMFVFGAMLGEGPLTPVEVIGSVLFGEEALLERHLPALLAGLIMHQLGPALFWSLVFGLCVHYFKIATTTMQLGLGLIIGVVSQVVDVDLLLPMAYQAMNAENIWVREVPAMWSWASHLVYGLCLAIYPVMDRKLARP